MRPPILLRSIMVIGLTLGLFAGDAFAGYFRRYPSSVEEETPAARPAQTDDGTGSYAPAEPAEAPGLLLALPHGGCGLTIEYIYTGEVFNNTRGGLNTNGATNYTGNIDLVMTADLDDMGFAPGGIAFIYARDRHGSGVGQHIGEVQGHSNLAGDPITVIGEFWWERAFCDDIFRLRIGKQAADGSFGFVELAGDFINDTFAGKTTTAFPEESMGAVLFTQLTDDLELKFGVFDGASLVTEWGFSDPGEPFAIMELRGNHELICGLPGQYHFGMWTADTGPNKGIYVGADQLIIKENPYDGDDDQGLGVFGQYRWAPKDRNFATQSFTLGMAYKGLLCCRDDDIVGAGVGTAVPTDIVPGFANETVVEMFYKAQLSPYTMVQPNMQYFGNPGCNGIDALVVGVRFELVL